MADEHAAVTIRKAKEADYRQVLGLYSKFVCDGRFSKEGNDSFHKILKDRNSHLDLAVIGNKIVGFISYSVRNVIRYPKPILEVEEMFVLENLQGKGIGKKLMDNTIGFASKNGFQYVFLASSKERVTAHKFYKHLGFEEYAFHFRHKP